MPKIRLESQLVKAGAGTGKTESLVREVYDLFKKYRKLEGRNPNLIVCTFTRKACQEMKERLFKKAIEVLAKNETLAITKEKSREEKQVFQKEKNNTLENPSFFLNYIQSPSLYISTIDGILNLFLKRYGNRFDLSPDFQLYHGQANERLFDSMTEEFIFKKNFSILRKIPYSFLKELFLFYFKCRLKYGEVSFYDEKNFEGFNQQKNMFLEMERLLKTGAKKQFDIAKIKQHFGTHKSLLKKLLNGNTDEMKKLFEEEESFKAEEFVPLFKEFDRAGKEFFLSFIEKKKNKSFLDMDDLLLFSLALLREKPKTAQDFSKEWDYWLIDEYQDTSWIQEQIISQITGFKNVFCVGDPAQSIYLFRDADPHVFKRREVSLGNKIRKLNTNYRSSASLIYFYNDFFPEDKGFMKIKPPENKQFHVNEPCVYFLTYEKSKNQNNKPQALQALGYYIQRLKTKGFSYSDIVVLSSKNDHLIEVADYLRGHNIPLMLYSSKNFAQKRLILDALFLLKFLINPYDDTNLKALLRTPYFYLSDQELADSSHDHFELCNNKEPISFWSFVKDYFSDRMFIKSLNLYLNVKNKQGLVKGFEKALMNSGFMDLSYFQDPTGSSESNLWKFLYLLNRDSSSPLKLFYSLMREADEEANDKEAPSCEDSESIKLMTIHKSKGLEFRNVIVMDFSIGNSLLRSGDKAKNSIIYDEVKQKMSFAVPIGGRDNLKIRSYGHKVYNKSKEEEKLLERERLFYVAMTRAKQNLAFFIPNFVPEQNSWLDRVDFFKKAFVSKNNCSLLEQKYNEKNKIKLWRLNEGHYKASHYSFCVKPSESIKSASQFINSESELQTFSFTDKLGQNKKNFFLKEGDYKAKNSILTGGKKYFETNCEWQVKSSKDFINDTIEIDEISYKDTEKYKDLKFVKKEQTNISDLKRKKVSDKEHKINSKKEFSLDEKKDNPFYLSKTKNILFKINLGNYLHFFLQKLSYQSFEQVIILIENSFLSQKDKEQIKQALIYIIQLKKPQMSLFVKTGFSEWPFKLQKRHILLQGRIDLWAWDSKEVHLFDYKSAVSQSLQAEKQLIFYSWVLEEFYHPKNIWMYEVYPFQGVIKKTLYSKFHRETVENWLIKNF